MWAGVGPKLGSRRNFWAIVRQLLDNCGARRSSPGFPGATFPGRVAELRKGFPQLVGSLSLSLPCQASPGTPTSAVSRLGGPRFPGNLGTPPASRPCLGRSSKFEQTLSSVVARRARGETRAGGGRRISTSTRPCGRNAGARLPPPRGPPPGARRHAGGPPSSAAREWAPQPKQGRHSPQRVAAEHMGLRSPQRVVAAAGGPPPDG